MYRGETARRIELPLDTAIGLELLLSDVVENARIRESFAEKYMLAYNCLSGECL